MSRKSDRWYRQTEALLYASKAFPIKIKSLEQQLAALIESIEPSMISNYTPQEGTHYNISSPVEAAVIKRVEGDQVQWLQQKIANLQALSDIVKTSIQTMLTNEEQDLVSRIYIKKQTWQIICSDLVIDKNTFYLRKNSIVSILAWCFNYMDDLVAEEKLGIFMDQALWQNQFLREA